jgi:hypothetical protein
MLRTTQTSGDHSLCTWTASTMACLHKQSEAVCTMTWTGLLHDALQPPLMQYCGACDELQMALRLVHVVQGQPSRGTEEIRSALCTLAVNVGFKLKPRQPVDRKMGLPCHRCCA